jgi:hypothetical protein
LGTLAGNGFRHAADRALVNWPPSDNRLPANLGKIAEADCVLPSSSLGCSHDSSYVLLINYLELFA